MTRTFAQLSRSCGSSLIRTLGLLHLFLFFGRGSLVAANEEFSLLLPQNEACAGSVIVISFVAPRNHSTENTVVVHVGQSQSFLSAQNVPAGPQGTLRFATFEQLGGRSLWFNYFASRQTSSSALLATAGPLVLGMPADICGVCGGDGSDCQGCDGVPNSGKTKDRCDVCGGNDSCVDCADVPFGGREEDRCGQCLLPRRVCQGGRLDGRPCTSSAECDLWPCQYGGGWDACVDCAGTPYGTAELDSCGACGGGDDRCDRDYVIRGPPAQTCVGDPLAVAWSGPANFPSRSTVAFSTVTADGSALYVVSWAYASPGAAGGLAGAFPADLAGGVLMGQSLLNVTGGAAQGTVTFNRSSPEQEFPSCGAEGQQRCLDFREYLRPLQPATYQLLLYPAPENPNKLAQSAPFEVLPHADVCGVCGGDGSSCVGCDGVVRSGKEWDRCGVCDGADQCVGCDGVPNSGRELDVCGVCGGDASSCTGCDGIARPDGPMSRDACGNCGGSDDSCGKPPRVGLLPFPVTFTCVGRGTKLYWEAPSNRSTADHISLCPASLLPIYNPIGCYPLLFNFVGPAGEAALEAGPMLRSPGEYELRYLVRQPPTSSVDFVVASRAEVAVRAPDDPSCDLLGYSVSPSRSEHCLGERVRLSWAADTSGDGELATAVLGVVQGEALDAPTCYPPCSGADGGCQFCFHRLCPAGTASCPRSGSLTLSSPDQGGLMSPTRPGAYRACLYGSLAALERSEPIVCSALFYVAAGEADVCGVCGGSGTACVGCDGEPNSGKVVDECGVCGGSGKSCRGCDGVANSGKELDACGVCGGDGLSCAGCDGVPNSGLKFDSCGICGGDDPHCADGYTLAIEGNCRTSRVTLQWSAPSDHPPLRLVVNSTGFPCRLQWGALGEFTPNFKFAAAHLHPAGYGGCGAACTAGGAEFIADPARLDMCATTGGQWTVWLDNPVSGKVMVQTTLLEIPDCGWCDRWYDTVCPFTEPPTTSSAELVTTSSTTELITTSSTTPAEDVNPETSPVPAPESTPEPVSGIVVRGHLVLDVQPSTLLEIGRLLLRALAFAGSLRGDEMSTEDVTVVAICRSDGALCEWLADREGGKGPWSTDDEQAGALAVFDMTLQDVSEHETLSNKIKSGQFTFRIAQDLLPEVGRKVEAEVSYFGEEREEAGVGQVTLLAGVVGGVLGLLCVGGGGWVVYRIRRPRRGGNLMTGPFQRMGEDDLGEGQAIELTVHDDAAAARRREQEQRCKEWVEQELHAPGAPSPERTAGRKLSLEDIDASQVEALDGRRSVERSSTSENGEDDDKQGRKIGGAKGGRGENGAPEGIEMGAKIHQNARKPTGGVEGGSGECDATDRGAGKGKTGGENGAHGLRAAASLETEASAEGKPKAQIRNGDQPARTEAVAVSPAKADADSGRTDSEKADTDSEKADSEKAGGDRHGSETVAMAEEDKGKQRNDEEQEQEHEEKRGDSVREAGTVAASPMSAESPAEGTTSVTNDEDAGGDSRQVPSEEAGDGGGIAHHAGGGDAKRKGGDLQEEEVSGRAGGAGAGGVRGAEKGAREHTRRSVGPDSGSKSPRTSKGGGGKGGEWVAIRTTMRTRSESLTSPASEDKRCEEGNGEQGGETGSKLEEDSAAEGQGCGGQGALNGRRDEVFVDDDDDDAEEGEEEEEEAKGGGEVVGRSVNGASHGVSVGAEEEEERGEAGRKVNVSETAGEQQNGSQRTPSRIGGKGRVEGDTRGSGSTGTGSPGTPPEGATDGEEQKEEDAGVKRTEGKTVKARLQGNGKGRAKMGRVSAHVK